MICTPIDLQADKNQAVIIMVVKKVGNWSIIKIPVRTVGGLTLNQASSELERHNTQRKLS